MPRLTIWSKAMEYLGLDQGTAPDPASRAGVDLVEYRVVTTPAEDLQLAAALNDLVADGWRLVQMLPVQHDGNDGYEPVSGSVRLVMQREAAS